MSDAGVRKQFKIIKELYKHAEYIVNCGDAGQEGELIQRWVMELAGVRCPVKRLWISSLTEEAIRQGFRDLRPQKKYSFWFQSLFLISPKFQQKFYLYQCFFLKFYQLDFLLQAIIR